MPEAIPTSETIIKAIEEGAKTASEGVITSVRVTANQVTISNNRELKTTKTYSKVRKKAKEVKFSDFKQTDPVLSSFRDLQEPEVLQKICPINDVHNIIDIQVE